MANRNKNVIAKRCANKGPNESGVRKRNGIHTFAAHIMQQSRISKTAAYKKALEQYQLTKDELNNLAQSLKIDISQLTST
jgi:hypothetical protein